jgi:hypothetical protein
MPNYVRSREIGSLSYKIEKRGNKYRLWLNGCGIGRPRPDKPAGEIWEYNAATIREAEKELEKDAKERLDKKIQTAEAGLAMLREVRATLG